MPEAHEDQEISVSLPAASAEEAAMLEMEDHRRKDQIIDELRKQLARFEGTQAGKITEFAKSPSARKRQIAHRKLLEQLNKLTFVRAGHVEGPCAPATVINFNPVPLTLQGELQRWTVPAAGKGNPIDMKFRGRTFRCSYMTIKTPHLYSVHSGTTNDRQSGVDMPVVDYAYIPPLGLVHQFFEHYVDGAADAQNMGGVLIFEGDIHALAKDRLDRESGNLWVPKKDITLEGYGDVVYVTEPKNFESFLEYLLTMQRNYIDGTIAQAQEFYNANADELRNQLSSYHRLWHNFALHMGYIKTPYPWATERLDDHPATEAVSCPDCHTRQKSPDQHFCPECNAPFDALKAFLAGKVVSIDRLSVYEGEELQLIRNEMLRRKKNIAFLEEAGTAVSADVAQAAGVDTANQQKQGGPQRGPDGKFLPKQGE